MVFGQMERTYAGVRGALDRAVATAKGRRIGRAVLVDAAKLDYAAHLRDNRPKSRGQLSAFADPWVSAAVLSPAVSVGAGRADALVPPRHGRARDRRGDTTERPEATHRVGSRAGYFDRGQVGYRGRPTAERPA